MSSNLLDDVIQFLEDEGHINQPAEDWCGIKGALPPDPDQVLVVSPTGGPLPETVPSGSTEIEYDEPTFQIMGRGGVYGFQELFNKMNDVFKSLHDSQLGKIEDYVQVLATQSGPFTLAADEKARPRLTWNYIAHRRRNAG